MNDWAEDVWVVLIVIAALVAFVVVIHMGITYSDKTNTDQKRITSQRIETCARLEIPADKINCLAVIGVNDG